MPSTKKARKPNPKAKKAAKRKSKKQSIPVRLLRTSERTTFKRCRFQWLMDYGMRLQPIREAPALRFGTLIHAALEERYPKGIKRGPHPARVFEKLYAADLKDAEESWRNFDAENEEWVDAEQLGVEMLEGYVDQFGRDEEWQVIESEMTFKVPVFIPKDIHAPLLMALLQRGKITEDQVAGKEPLFYYVGTMDGLWKNRMDGRLRIIDYKTTSKDAQKEAEGKNVLDEQGTAYWTWGCDDLIAKKILKPRAAESLDGMLYVMLKKSKRDERPVNDQGQSLNKDGSVSKVQPAPRFYRHIVYRSESDREKARERVVHEMLEIMAVEEEVIAAYKNPETGSNGHCHWCPYRDPCEIHEAGADFGRVLEGTMETWDPYSAHEIKDAENRS